MKSNVREKSLSRSLRILVSSMMLFGGITGAMAHPHEFVDMKIRLMFSEANKVNAIRYVWLFDEFFSAFAIEPADHDGDGKPEQAGLDALAVEILGNIGPLNYMTKFDSAAMVPEFRAAKPVSSTMVGRQLRLEFIVSFKEPVVLAGKSLRYAVYDNEFYIAMHHSMDNDAVELSGAGKGCSFDLQPADPSESITEFANSLGKDETGGDNLGANFAEWVTVSCK